ncbi:QRFP-like peptide receptor [Manduca sexta]|uniref:QRFP-like peptide receptor n=1 Tax=Manduca sexta TaxID=7130 RepID=UPI00189086FC|nr:QRFP-like peptide receptor [Manduca sexta]
MTWVSSPRTQPPMWAPLKPCVTNIFLVNLSVADLLVTLFCMPVQIAKAVTVLWYFGEVMCKTLNFLQGVAVASSVFTITAMSVDRYLAITQSLRQPWMPSRRGACALLAALWLVAFAIFAPLLAVAAVERERVPLLSRTRNGSTATSGKRPDHLQSFLNNIKKKELVPSRKAKLFLKSQATKSPPKRYRERFYVSSDERARHIYGRMGGYT